MEIKLDLWVLIISIIAGNWAIARMFVFKPLNEIANDLKEFKVLFASLDKRVTILEVLKEKEIVNEIRD